MDDIRASWNWFDNYRSIGKMKFGAIYRNIFWLVAGVRGPEDTRGRAERDILSSRGNGQEYPTETDRRTLPLQRRWSLSASSECMSILASRWVATTGRILLHTKTSYSMTIIIILNPKTIYSTLFYFDESFKRNSNRGALKNQIIILLRHAQSIVVL